jgi:hypothetical protein
MKVKQTITFHKNGTGEEVIAKKKKFDSLT